MGRVNSSNKGGSNERETAKVLSLWWSEGKSDSVFVRTPGSGSMGTVRANGVEHLYGDIMAIGEDGKELTKLFNIELKKGYDHRKTIKTIDGKTHKEIVRYDILDIIDSKQEIPQILRFWRQCCDDAQKSGRKPLLIFQRYGRNPIVCFKHPKLLFVNYLSLTSTRNVKVGIIQTQYFDMMSLDEFLKLVDPEIIKTYIDENLSK